MEDLYPVLVRNLACLYVPCKQNSYK